MTVLSASRNALRFTGLRWTLPTARDHRQVRHSARGEAAELLTSPQGLDPVLIGRGAPLRPCYYRLVDHRLNRGAAYLRLKPPMWSREPREMAEMPETVEGVFHLDRAISIVGKIARALVGREVVEKAPDGAP